jgi:hypothetical protein
MAYDDKSLPSQTNLMEYVVLVEGHDVVGSVPIIARILMEDEESLAIVCGKYEKEDVSHLRNPGE